MSALQPFSFHDLVEGSTRVMTFRITTRYLNIRPLTSGYRSGDGQRPAVSMFCRPNLTRDFRPEAAGCA